MPAAPLPENEEQCMKPLRALQFLDPPPEELFDRVTRLAARILTVPFAYIILLNANRQFLKSRYGADLPDTSRDSAFCAHTILEDKQMVVPDAKHDARFADNPLVTGKPDIRFYIGNPIAAPDGSRVGTLCAIDHLPRIPSSEDLTALRDLALIAQTELNLRATTEAYQFQQQT